MESTFELQASAGEVAHPQLNPLHIIIGEVQNVVASMRLNSRWSSVRARNQDTKEAYLLINLINLRRRFESDIQDIKQVDLIEVVRPFLDVIRSDKTSGPITGVALSSIYKFLQYGIISLDYRDIPQLIDEIGSAVTHCRFERTDPETDEVVLVKILKVLLKIMQIDAGCLLSDEIVYDMVQTAFKMSIQHHLSVLLRKSAEMTVLEMVQTAFTLFQSKKKVAIENLIASRSSSTTTANADSSKLGNDYIPPEQQSAEKSPPNSPKVAVRDHVNPLGVQFEGDDEPEKGTGSFRPFGLPVLIKLFRFACSIINPTYAPNTDSMRFLGLGLINSILETKAATISKTPKLLTLVQEDLCKYLLQNLYTDNVSILTMAMRVAFNLWVTLRHSLKFQMELFFNTIFNTLWPNEHEMSQGAQYIAYEQQEITLETIVALCQEPSFVIDVYIAYDCDVHFGNLFAKLVDFLYKTANQNTINGALQSTQLLALDGLLAILQSVVRYVRAPPTGANAGVDIASTVSRYVEELRNRKKVKQLLFEGVERFNKSVDGKVEPALTFLQENGLLPTPLSPEAVALFLRHAPGLNKKVVGEYLGAKKDFNLEVLRHYCRTFSLKNKRFVDAAREFFESFRIPGEGQVVERITDIYAHDYYTREKGLFNSEDACYLATFSVLMINVNIHNPNVRPQDKLTLEKYIKQMKGQNTGQDFPQEFLIEIFESIKENELKIPEELQWDKQINSVTWRYLIQRYNNSGFSNGTELPSSAPTWMIPFTAPTDPSLRIGFYELLFASSWRQIITAAQVVYQHTFDVDLAKRIIKAFYWCAEVCAHFKFYDAMDTLVISLCELSTLKTVSSSSTSVFASRFGRDKKAQLATVALFTIIRAYVDNLRESWKNVIDSLAILKKLKLLPELMQLEDIFKFKQPTIIEKPSESTGSPIFGLVSNFWPFGGGSSSETGVDEAQSPLKEQTAAVLNECKLPELIQRCSDMSLDSLSILFKVLMHESLPKNKRKSGSPTTAEGSVDISTAFLCLDMLVYIMIVNSSRAKAVWPIIHEHFERLLTTSTIASQILDKAIVSLLFLSSYLLRNPQLAEDVAFSLQLLTRLPQELQNEFAEKLTVGIARAFRRNVPYITRPKVWEMLMGMIRLGLHYPKFAKECFDTLVFIVRPQRLLQRDPSAFPADPSCLDASYVNQYNFELVIESIAAFAKHPSSPTETALESLELYQALFSVVPSLIGVQASPGSIQHIILDPKQESEAMYKYWIPLFTQLVEKTRDTRVLVRHHAMSNLQKALLAPEMQLCSSDSWLVIFDKVIFPLLVELLQPVSVDTPHDVVEETRLRAASILCKTFLHYMTKINPSAFKMLWLKVLSFVEMYMKADSSELLAEAVTESLKNILLVMFTSGLLTRPGDESTPTATQEQKELWELSWRTIDGFAPQLKQEFLSKVYPNITT